MEVGPMGETLEDHEVVASVVHLKVAFTLSAILTFSGFRHCLFNNYSSSIYN